MKKTKNLTIPSDLGLAEGEVVRIITEIAKRVAPKYKFAYFTEEDMIQEAIILGIECLDRYNPELPLENFVTVHIINRLLNLRRKHGVKPEPKDPKEKARWQDRQNILRPIGIHEVRNETENSMWSYIDLLEEASIEDIFDIINQNLPIDLRPDYLRMMSDVHVPKPRREKIEGAILEILRSNGYETW